jgi:hypothetical protein
MESDYRYYSRRAAEERRRAAQSVTAEARERHSELASLFANRAAQRPMSEEPQMASG